VRGRVAKRVTDAATSGSLAVLIAAGLSQMGSGTSALAAAGLRPAWTIGAVAKPTNFSVGDPEDEYGIILTNVGGVAAAGVITVTDTLPPGITTSATAKGKGWKCSEGSGQTKVTCK